MCILEISEANDWFSYELLDNTAQSYHMLPSAPLTASCLHLVLPNGRVDSPIAKIDVLTCSYRQRRDWRSVWWEHKLHKSRARANERHIVLLLWHKCKSGKKTPQQYRGISARLADWKQAQILSSILHTFLLSFAEEANVKQGARQHRQNQIHCPSNLCRDLNTDKPQTNELLTNVGAGDSVSPYHNLPSQNDPIGFPPSLLVLPSTVSVHVSGEPLWQ